MPTPRTTVLTWHRGPEIRLNVGGWRRVGSRVAGGVVLPAVVDQDLVASVEGPADDRMAENAPCATDDQ